MDRDTIIESHLRTTPGARLLCGRVAGQGAWFARIVFHGEFTAASCSTSLSAALDALAEALSHGVAA